MQQLLAGSAAQENAGLGALRGRGRRGGCAGSAVSLVTPRPLRQGQSKAPASSGWDSVRESSTGVGMGQPLFSFQDKLEPFLCFPLPVHSQEGPPALPAWGEELRDVAKQAPGVPVPGPRQAGGAGALSGWSSSERALSLQHAGPRAEGLTRCGPMCAGRTVLPRCPAARRRRSQRHVRCRLQALPRRPLLGAAAGLVPPPVRVIPQI